MRQRRLHMNRKRGKKKKGFTATVPLEKVPPNKAPLKVDASDSGLERELRSQGTDQLAFGNIRQGNQPPTTVQEERKESRARNRFPEAWSETTNNKRKLSSPRLTLIPGPQPVGTTPERCPGVSRNFKQRNNKKRGGGEKRKGLSNV